MAGAAYGGETCRSIVEDELLALEAIYPDCITRLESSEDGGTLIKLELPISLGREQPIRVEFEPPPASGPGQDSSTSTMTPESLEEVLVVSHLPPLILDLRLSSAYPLHDPPLIISAYFAHSWLPSSLMLPLMRSFYDLWVEQKGLGEGVLWRIAEVILDGSFLDHTLHIADSSSATISLTHPAPKAMAGLLRWHDARMGEESFARTTFFCLICLESRKGTACIQLSCGHIFCKGCLREGWGMAVREGDCGQVKCPDTRCLSANSNAQANEPNSEAAEEDVRRVLTDEEVTRWKWLKVKRDIERDPSIVHCPLQFCQAPVRPPASANDHSPGEELSAYSIGWFKFRMCEGCGYSFCVFCRKSWHGPLIPCETHSTSAILKEYRSLPESSQRRKALERSIGRKNLQRMIAKAEEEEMSQKYIEEFTTGCPKCHTRCEKSYGCNHMMCAQCGQHYCFLCGDYLNATNPYAHYSEKWTRCYGKLFERPGEVPDEILFD
ncbi:uncharacterized protein EI90DRAFT_3054460 [Cantharellus anzutake]|uniref:uncharacterized protein n=1 Tax=Cantharellus anzutake TaxID=1750568 RepID=UPI001907B1E9|nr:uncharacterized protein EI90DRAFT_3054460 [Cantharellus anzutake]KAF8332798.1 hypothetical protein EI90DRAFT_3054460 [Cantharellus anzutake]